MRTKLASMEIVLNHFLLSIKERKKVADKKERKIMNTDEMKRLYIKVAKEYYSRENRDFTIDENNQNYLNLLCKYFSRDIEFETIHRGELRKGLLVIGNPGTGKSSSFKIIQMISKIYGLQSLWFPIVETKKVVEKFNVEKNKDSIIENYSIGTFCFDDLGSENEANNIHVWGSKEDIFIRILENRYDEFIAKNTKTFITTNLSLIQIEKRYGSRVRDRFVSMFNLIELNGTSRRF